MNRLQTAAEKFQTICSGSKIQCEPLLSEQHVKSYLIPKAHKNKSQHLRRQTKPLVSYNIHHKTCAIPEGVIHIISDQIITENVMSENMLKAQEKLNAFYFDLTNALSTHVDEAQIKSPTKALHRKQATEQFPSRFVDKTIDDKIEEALDGIATPDDIQPQESLKALFGALKDSGLAATLKKAGISTHVAEPGKHMVTFLKNKTPVLQYSSLELADDKKLGEALQQLQSLASGKAPQAAALELDIVRQAAKAASDEEKRFTDMAQQYAPQRPEDEQQQQVSAV